MIRGSTPRTGLVLVSRDFRWDLARILFVIGGKGSKIFGSANDFLFI